MGKLGHSRHKWCWQIDFIKILSGTLQASSGRFEMSGQVAALLELGAGFHPEFSGRKNIHLNASLLGVSEQNIT